MLERVRACEECVRERERNCTLVYELVRNSRVGRMRNVCVCVYPWVCVYMKEREREKEKIH